MNPGDVLKESARGNVGRPHERRWVSALIAAETALTLTLLVCGALLVRAYGRLDSVDLGYEREGIARLAITLSRADAGLPEARHEVFRRLRAAVQATRVLNMQVSCPSRCRRGTPIAAVSDLPGSIGMRPRTGSRPASIRRTRGFSQRWESDFSTGVTLRRAMDLVVARLQSSADPLLRAWAARRAPSVGSLVC